MILHKIHTLFKQSADSVAIIETFITGTAQAIGTRKYCPLLSLTESSSIAVP